VLQSMASINPEIRPFLYSRYQLLALGSWLKASMCWNDEPIQ